MRALARARLEAALWPTLIGLLITAVVGDLLILAAGQSPAPVWSQMLNGTWGNPYGVGQVLYKATTLTCTGLAVALGLRAGLFNVGAEGQLAAGGFLAALTGLAMPQQTPALFAIMACTVAAVVGGGVVGWVPGVLRTRFGAHEVITTIMLNFIVLAILNWLVASYLRVPETLHTREVHAGVLPRLSESIAALHGSPANWSFAIVLCAAAFLGWWLFRTVGGYELRAVGWQPEAARHAGVRVSRVIQSTMLASGAMAGLGGINFVLGYKHYYEEGFAGGSGYLGIAVAIVGRNDPLGVVVAALLFATLSQGGLAINAVVPKEIVGVLQGVVILGVAVSAPEVRRALLASRSAP